MPRDMFGYHSPIPKKEKLETELKEYKCILSRPIYKYLEEILNLEYSVIRPNISDGKRIALSRLKIYGGIVKYNLYHRSFNLIKENSRGVTIDDGSSGFDWLYVSSNEGVKSRQLFNYDAGGRFHKSIQIDLYSANKESIKDEVKRLEERRSHISGPWGGDYDAEGNALYGGKNSREMQEAVSRFEAHTKTINELKEKSETNLSKDDKKVIKLGNKFSELFLEEFGLTPEDFQEKETDSKILQKTYVTIPGTITIYRTTHFI